VSEKLERPTPQIPRVRKVELPPLPPEAEKAVTELSRKAGWDKTDGPVGEGGHEAAPKKPDPAPKATRTNSKASPVAQVEAPQPFMPMRRRKQVDEPTISFTARISVRSHNAFLQWCHDERIPSYREAFDMLMDMLERERAK